MKGFSIKYVIAKLEYLSWHFSFSPFELKFHYLLFLELSTHQDSTSCGLTAAAKVRKLNVHGVSLLTQTCSGSYKKKKKEKNGGKKHHFLLSQGLCFLFLSLNRSMTFSTLLTSLATCHCLWRVVSFVLRGGGLRPMSCT